MVEGPAWSVRMIPWRGRIQHERGSSGSNMNAAVEEPRLLHALPGRMRVHLAGWPPEGPCAAETRLRQVPGVLSVQANPLTGNVLVHFDTSATDAQAILA